MLELNFNPFPVLTTKHLKLRRLSGNDAGELFFLRSDKEVMKYVGRAPAKSVEEVLKFIQQINMDVSKNELIYWGITLNNDDTLIGTICLWKILKEHHRAEVGYVLHPLHQGKGLMDEALGAVINYGFSKMNLHSIEAHVSPDNAASIRLLERNYFVREGYFRENYFFNGKFLDSMVYSLIRPKG